MGMKYIQQAPYDEGMKVFYSVEIPPPHTHTVWEGDFMGACVHDIACPVCFDAAAIVERNVTPGQYTQSVQPCHACDDEGYRVVLIPKWFRPIARWMGFIS